MMLKMKERSIYILIAMMAVVLITSAFGAYRDSESESDVAESSKPSLAIPETPLPSPSPTSDVIGASGAGTSHKTAKMHLDTSVKSNGPYVDDGTNEYKGKATGHSLERQR